MDYLVYTVLAFGAYYFLTYLGYYLALGVSFGCYVLAPLGLAPSVSRSKSGFPTSRLYPYPTWNLTTLPAWGLLI